MLAGELFRASLGSMEIEGITVYVPITGNEMKHWRNLTAP
jgi:hypothetical protein